MGCAYNAKKIWALGDLVTEAGAPLTGFNANGQAWFDATTTPDTVGQMTGTGGTFPVASLFTIDTKGCDLLAIAFAAKITAVGTQTLATGSAVRPAAFGTPYSPPNGVLKPAWDKPYSMRTAQANTVATGQFNNEALSLFGDTTIGPGMSESDWGESIVQNALMQADGSDPVAGDYLRWSFFIGRRMSEDNVYGITTTRNFSNHTLTGIARVSLAFLVLNASTAGGAPAQSMAAEMYAVRIWRNGNTPSLGAVQANLGGQ